jgi:ribosome-binding protein aMBF1 (putative translation factor)
MLQSIQTIMKKLAGIAMRNLEQLSPDQQAQLEAALNQPSPRVRKVAPLDTIETSLEALQEAIQKGTTQKRIGMLLQQARQQAQLSGRKTARNLKMNPAQLRKLENSDTNLEVSSLVRVAHELEFDVTIRLEPRQAGVVLEAKF